MTDIAIKVENLGKRYSLGQRGYGGQKSGDFRESLTHFFRPKTQSPKPNPQDPKDFWALKDVNFEIKQGEAVGIIGRNGAGKSTLLKILSRITEPTKGRFEIFGRVSSLLEVGTGFHEELTGRENVYLNGTILGMRRTEVKAKFDEIIDFSGVEKFIDTPVKHYSSGMKVRLAFAVAAHLEPEILIIDEVLAVGDAEFQKKCLGKMEDVTQRGGRTVLFVSHNMGAVESLCTRGVIFHSGQTYFDGEAPEAINRYLNAGKANGDLSHVVDLSNHQNKKYRRAFGLQKAEVFVNDKPSTILAPGDDLRIKFYFKLEDTLVNPILGIVIRSPYDEPFIGINNRHTSEKLYTDQEEGVISVSIPNVSMYGSGQCGVDLYFGDNEDNFDTINDAFYLDLKASDVFQSGVFVNPTLNKVYQPQISFTLENCESIVRA